MNGRSGSQYFLRCTLRNGQALPQECFVSTDDIPKTRYLMILIPHMDDQAGSMERRRGSKPACGVSGTQKRKVTKNKKKFRKPNVSLILVIHIVPSVATRSWANAFHSSRNRPGTVRETGINCSDICYPFDMGVSDILSSFLRVN